MGASPCALRTQRHNVLQLPFRSGSIQVRAIDQIQMEAHVELVKMALAGMYRVLGYDYARDYKIKASTDTPILSVYFSHPGNKYMLPHGYVAYYNRPNPWCESRTYATHQFALQSNGKVTFAHGRYDLTKDEALLDCAERAGVLPAHV